MTSQFLFTKLAVVTSLFAAPPNVVNMQTAVFQNDPPL